MAYQYTHDRRATRKVNLTAWGFAIVLVIGVGLGINLLFAGTSGFIVSPLAEELATEPIRSVIFGKKSKNFSELIGQIAKLIDTKTGTYSVYIFDINKNSGVGVNETTIFTAASVNKLPILAGLYYETQAGTIDLDKRITIQANDIQDYGTGSIRYEGPGGVYSLKSLAQLMIEKSDNTAAVVLTRIIGEVRLQELVDSWGLMQTDIASNKTSNKDIALLLTKMYTGKTARDSLTLEMIGFMDDSDFENRLPALLPAEVSVYHKIGTEVGNVHDVGIVALENNPYYIGVMSNDITNEAEAEATIAQISKLTYNFMVNE